MWFPLLFTQVFSYLFNILIFSAVNCIDQVVKAEGLLVSKHYSHTEYLLTTLPWDFCYFPGTRCCMKQFPDQVNMN
uniref:Secreted protein n=1 Tax=Pyxicephalus adspersus TaxID=30357 RepID=A0AAV3B2U9_PYXAD|nr:TPA: hypothetical protein GDO54_000171 [Pyxicephalus adspersus]